MARSWIAAAAIVVLVTTGGAEACSQRGRDSATEWRQLLDRSTGVYVVTLVRSRLHGVDPVSWGEESESGSIEDLLDRARVASQQSIEYEFRVLEVIHGAYTESVSVELPHRRMTANNNHFDQHRQSTFWDDPSVGRAMLAADCSVVANFRYGDAYILIQSDRWHVKSFERVTSRDDAYYQFLADRFRSN